MFDPHHNLAVSAVASAPSPATSGTSLTLTAGHGTRFPDPAVVGAYNCTVWDGAAMSDPTNSEVVRVTAKSTDTLTIVRAQETGFGGPAARSIVAGDLIAATITAKTLQDAEKQGLRQSFRGLHLRTHPDADVAANKVMLLKADRIVMHDGEGVDDWSNLVADITVSGAGGLDTGAEGSSLWYEIHAIRKSSDGTKDLLLHRAKSYDLDQSLVTGDDTGVAARYATTTRTAIAQGFTPAVTGFRHFIDLYVEKTGSPTGSMWIELQSNNAGVPSNTVLATSDKLDVSFVAAAGTPHWVRFIFRTPVSLTASTVYHIVLTGNWTASDTNYLSWRSDNSSPPYAGGQQAWKESGTWAAQTRDGLFRDYVLANDAAVTMPAGYDQRCLIGWVYNQNTSVFREFIQLDRLVKLISFSQVVLSGGSGAIQTLLDISVGVPPIPVTVSGWNISTSTAASGSIVVHNLAAAGAARMGFYYNGPILSFSDLDLSCPVEYQSVYYLMASGALWLYINRWSW